jgi:hypothetical protein
MFLFASVLAALLASSSAIPSPADSSVSHVCPYIICQWMAVINCPLLPLLKALKGLSYEGKNALGLFFLICTVTVLCLINNQPNFAKVKYKKQTFSSL